MLCELARVTPIQELPFGPLPKVFERRLISSKKFMQFSLFLPTRAPYLILLCIGILLAMLLVFSRKHSPMQSPR